MLEMMKSIRAQLLDLTASNPELSTRIGFGLLFGGLFFFFHTVTFGHDAQTTTLFGNTCITEVDQTL